MQAMSMIDTSTNMIDSVAPAVNSGSPSSSDFDQVMERQCNETASASNAAEKPRRESGTKAAAKAETPQAPSDSKAQQEVTESSVAQQQNIEQAEDASSVVALSSTEQVQQTVEQLVVALEGGDSGTDEGGASVEDLLMRLVQQLEEVEPEESSEIAGLDMSMLKDQLQNITTDDDGIELEQFVEQLAVELEQQVSAFTPQSQSVESVAMTQTVQMVQIESSGAVLPEVRQALQKAINTIAGEPGQAANAESQVAAVDPDLAPEGTEIDPRFANLLKPRSENAAVQTTPLRAETAKVTVASEGGTASSVMTEETAEFELGAKPADLLSSSADKSIDQMMQQLQGAARQGQPQVRQPVVNLPQGQNVHLPSGQQVSEGQVLDQVVTHISGSKSGETGRMVLRLQPAELGALKIDLQIEGDRVKANLHAQSTQVQEVIERNLPQLRNALAEQGLKIDEFKVDIDKGQQQGSFDNLAGQQQQRESSNPHAAWSQESEVDDNAVPLAHLMQNGGGGISLHV